MDQTSNPLKPYYQTEKGSFFLDLSEHALNNSPIKEVKGQIQLILTSPPFPLNRKKKYGNLTGTEYISWFSKFAVIFSDYLSENGSIVLEIGNAWNPGIPTTSTLPIECLLAFKQAGNFHLCQEFINFNPARLPSPIQWVNKERIRAKDAFTRLWWLSKSPRPYADNRQVLNRYSEKMKKLLASKKYNSGRRPSEHHIGKTSFLHDNGGSIPPNVLISANTKSSDSYLIYCKQNNIEPHPARMPEKLAAFFVKFLTRNNDYVMDPFAGSNTTGAVSEYLSRRWISIEPNEFYARGSKGRFAQTH
jgi:hypothetical protein